MCIWNDCGYLSMVSFMVSRRVCVCVNTRSRSVSLFRCNCTHILSSHRNIRMHFDSASENIIWLPFYTDGENKCVDTTFELNGYNKKYSLYLNYTHTHTIHMLKYWWSFNLTQWICTIISHLIKNPIHRSSIESGSSNNIKKIDGWRFIQFHPLR